MVTHKLHLVLAQSPWLELVNDCTTKYQLQSDTNITFGSHELHNWGWSLSTLLKFNIFTCLIVFWRWLISGWNYQSSIIADQQAWGWLSLPTALFPSQSVCCTGAVEHWSTVCCTGALWPLAVYPSSAGGVSQCGALSALADSRNFLLPWVQKWQHRRSPGRGGRPDYSHQLRNWTAAASLSARIPIHPHIIINLSTSLTKDYHNIHINMINQIEDLDNSFPTSLLKRSETRESGQNYFHLSHFCWK